MLSRKHIRAPKSYDPGKGRPREHLAYVSPAEMALIRSLTDGTIEMGPHGIPSFADDSASSKGVSRGGNGAVGSSGNWSGAPGGSSSGSRTGGSTSNNGSTSRSGGTTSNNGSGSRGGSTSSGSKSTSSSSSSSKGSHSGTNGTGSKSTSSSSGAKGTGTKSAPSSASKSTPSTSNKSFSGGGKMGASSSQTGGVSAPPSRAAPSGGKTSNNGSKSSSATAGKSSSTGTKTGTASAMAGKSFSGGGKMGSGSSQTGGVKAAPKSAPSSSVSSTAKSTLSASQKAAYTQAGRLIGAPAGNTASFPGQGTTKKTGRRNPNGTAEQMKPNAWTDTNAVFKTGPAPDAPTPFHDWAAGAVSRLNNLSRAQNEQMARTIAGEAAGESPFGRAAVANTMNNRMLNGMSFDQMMPGFDANGLRHAATAGRSGAPPNSGYLRAEPGTANFNKGLGATLDASDPYSGFNMTAPPSLKTADHYVTTNKERTTRWARGDDWENSRTVVGNHVFGNPNHTASRIAARRDAAFGPGGSYPSMEVAGGKTDLDAGERTGLSLSSTTDMSPVTRPALAAPTPTLRPEGIGVAPIPTPRPEVQGPRRSFAELPNRQYTEQQIASANAPRPTARPPGVGVAPIPTPRPEVQGPVRGIADLPNRQFAERSYAPSEYSGYGEFTAPPQRGDYTGYGAPFHTEVQGPVRGIADLPNRQLAERSYAPSEYTGYGSSNVPPSMQYQGYGSWPSGQERVLGVEDVPEETFAPSAYAGYGTFNPPAMPSQYSGYGSFTPPAHPDGTFTNYYDDQPAPEVAAPPSMLAKGVGVLNDVLAGKYQLPNLADMPRLTPKEVTALKMWQSAQGTPLEGMANRQFEKAVGPMVSGIVPGAISGLQRALTPAGGTMVADGPPGGFQTAGYKVEGEGTGKSSFPKDQSRVGDDSGTASEAPPAASGVGGTNPTGPGRKPAQRGTGPRERASQGRGSPSGTKSQRGRDGGGGGERHRLTPKSNLPPEAQPPFEQDAYLPPVGLGIWGNVMSREMALRKLLGEEWYA